MSKTFVKKTIGTGAKAYDVMRVTEKPASVVQDYPESHIDSEVRRWTAELDRVQKHFDHWTALKAAITA